MIASRGFVTGVGMIIAAAITTTGCASTDSTNAPGTCNACQETVAAPAAMPAVQYIDPASAPDGPGWISLIASDMGGWHQRSKDRPMSWKVVDGIMVNEPSAGSHGVDIVTDRTFRDFDVYYEFRVPKGSNSGVYLRGRYEIQVLDDAGQDPNRGGNGAVYGVAAPARNVSRPAGEWQSVRAKITGERITVILNGVKVIDNVEVKNATGGALDDKVDQPGPLMIQGDHGAIEVRRLMVRPAAP